MSTTEISVDGAPLSHRGARSGPRPGKLHTTLRRLEGRIDPALRTLFWIAALPGLALALFAGLAAHAPDYPVHGLGALALQLPPLPALAGVPMGPLLHGAALLTLLALVYRLVRLDALPAIAERATWLAFLAPTTALLWRHPTLVISAILALLAIYLSRRAHWWWAGATGAILACWHPGGAILTLPLLAQYLAVRGFAPQRWKGSLIATLLPLVAAIAIGLAHAASASDVSWKSALAFSLTGTTAPALPWVVAMDWYAAAAQSGPSSAAALPLLALLLPLCLWLVGLRHLRAATVTLVPAVCLLALATADPAAVLALTPILLPLLIVPARLLEGKAGLERGLSLVLLLALILLLGASPHHIVR